MLRRVKSAQEGQKDALGVLRRMLGILKSRSEGCAGFAQDLLRGCPANDQRLLRGLIRENAQGSIRGCSEMLRGWSGDAQVIIRGCSGGCPEGCCSEDAQEGQGILRRCSENAQAMLRGFLGECSEDAHRLLHSSSFASLRRVGSAQPLARLLYKFLTQLIIVWRMFWQLHKRITRSLTQQPGSAAINPAVSLGAGFSHRSPLPGSSGKFGELNRN